MSLHYEENPRLNPNRIACLPSSSVLPVFLLSAFFDLDAAVEPCRDDFRTALPGSTSQLPLRAEVPTFDPDREFGVDRSVM